MTSRSQLKRIAIQSGSSLELVQTALELGRKAFEAGLTRVPAIDPNFMPVLAGLQVGQSLPILDAWLRGWDEANLAAPVEGWTDEENAKWRQR